MKRLICLLMLLLLPITVACEDNWMRLNKPQEECERFLRNVALVSWTESYEGRLPVCFDVRADGMVALGFDRPRGGKYVAVIDRDGAFQYGYAFQCTGSFMLEWAEDALGIFWIRSNVYAAFDAQGKCVDICDYDADGGFTGQCTSSRAAGEDVYMLQGGRLIRRDGQGNEIILHDASGAAVLQWIGFAAVAAFVAVCLGVSIRKSRSGRIDNPQKS